MATQETIVQQIERTVGGEYHDWQIGLTDDSSGSKAALGNPLSWLQWQADSADEAVGILDYFVQKGMQSVGKITRSGEFVFVLLVDNPSA